MWGRAGEENTGQARPVGEEPHTPFPQRWGFILQATGRPGRICGVEGSNQMCVLERSLWLRVEENGVETGKTGRRLWTESGEDDGGQTRALAVAIGRFKS